MIIKTAIQFLNYDSDAILISKTGGILTAMAGNVYYPAPTPDLLPVQTALNELVVAVNNAAGGGVVLTAIKKAKRAVLVRLLRQLASYVQVTCNGDLMVLRSSGFPIQKPQRQPIGMPSAPSGLVLTVGARTGELNASASPVVGAGTYNWRVTTAANPNTVVQTAQTTAASTTFANLTPGVIYNVQLNAVAAAGTSDWSAAVPLMVV